MDRVDLLIAPPIVPGPHQRDWERLHAWTHR
jgi:hypothetical protein